MNPNSNPDGCLVDARICQVHGDKHTGGQQNNARGRRRKGGNGPGLLADLTTKNSAFHTRQQQDCTRPVLHGRCIAESAPAICPRRAGQRRAA